MQNNFKYINLSWAVVGICENPHQPLLVHIPGIDKDEAAAAQHIFIWHYDVKPRRGDIILPLLTSRVSARAMLLALISGNAFTTSACVNVKLPLNGLSYIQPAILAIILYLIFYLQR